MIIYIPLFLRNYSALTIWPFIFIKHKQDKNNQVLINHEKIHLRQQIELLWAIFFIWYIVEFLIKYIKYKNWNKAYRAISFEREAFQNEINPDFIKTKKIWSFYKYL